MQLRTIDHTGRKSLEGHTILLAEDCPDQGRLYLRTLETAGAKVVLECNGQAAVNTIARNPARFDAVVMDFQMPEMDGLFATLRLRQEGFAGPIVAITALDSPQLEKSWFAAGCDAFLTKSLDRMVLISTLREFLCTAAVDR